MIDRLYTKISLLCIAVILSSISFSRAQVTQRDTLLAWHHFEYSLDNNNGMGSYSTTNIIEDHYPGLVLENEYIRLVVLPGFGARVISYYYKPTGHEQFYTNPVGAPYGMGDGNFYYDWLMVFGGVFPTFPEPEHGKTWFLAWDWEFTELSPDRISLKMELMDTINYPSHPGKFNNGITEARCISTVTLEAGKTSFEFSHSLQNTKSTSIPLEFWTCTTLAPGSEPGNTFTPANSEIIVPLEYIYLKDDWWSWMGQAEVPAAGQGSHVFEYKNLAIYDNWEDMGIAYAFPNLEAGYYGVVNHENGEGVFRVSDNAGVTPGMKFWTWGADQGLNADPENFYEVARPYIELWSGLSTQFFQDEILAPQETITMVETYLPTVDMDSITLVNENGAIHLNYDKNPDRFMVKVFSTMPGETFNLDLSLNGLNQYQLYDQEFVSKSESSNYFSVSLEDYTIENGDYEFIATVTDQGGETTLESSIQLTVPFPSQGVPFAELPTARVARLSPDLYRVDFENSTRRTLELISMSGQLLERKIIYDQSAYLMINIPGVYVLHITENSIPYSIKLMR